MQRRALTPLSAAVCNLLAETLDAVEDRANAVVAQATALALSERLNGPDHYETAKAHGDLARLMGHSHGGGGEAPLAHRQRALFLLQLGAPALHPLVVDAYHSLGLTYANLRATAAAQACLAEALRRSGTRPMQACVMRHHIALTHCLGGNFREGKRWEAESLAVLQKW